MNADTADCMLLGIIYPSVGFAIWHVSPQPVSPGQQPGPVFSSLLGCLLLGLVWGAVAWRSGSVVGCVLSHAVTDLLGVGAIAYLRW